MQFATTCPQAKTVVLLFNAFNAFKPYIGGNEKRRDLMD
jgi:hypothetical protein